MNESASFIETVINGGAFAVLAAVVLLVMFLAPKVVSNLMGRFDSALAAFKEEMKEQREEFCKEQEALRASHERVVTNLSDTFRIEMQMFREENKRLLDYALKEQP